MQSQKSKFGLIGWLMLSIGLLIALTIFLVYLKKRKQQADNLSEAQTKKPFNEESLRGFQTVAEYMRNKGYNNEISNTIAAVAVYETGGFTSKLFNENNNLFGMKQPRVRQTTSIGEKNGYASFETRADSCEDFCLWLVYNKFPEDSITNLVDFVNFMKDKKYFEQDLTIYRNNVQGIYKMYSMT